MLRDSLDLNDLPPAILVAADVTDFRGPKTPHIQKPCYVEKKDYHGT